MQKKYKTNRLELSQLEKQDLPELNQLLSDDQLTQASGLQLPENETQRLVALSVLVGDEFIYLIRLVQTRQLIGVIGFYQCYQPDFEVSHQYRELGYLLARNSWGNGYMTEAGDRLINELFATTSYQYVCAGVAPTNQRSQHVLTRLKLIPNHRPRMLATTQFADDELYFQRSAK